MIVKGSFQLARPLESGAAGSDTRLAELVCNQEADVLFVLPGYDYTFRESVRRAALLSALYSKDMNRPLIPVVFSWPSLGMWTKYEKDRERASASGDAIALAMQGMAKCKGRRIHLVAHSTGAHALQHALNSSRHKLKGRIFETVILAAADTDHDALDSPNKLGRLARVAKSVHCYINARDYALKYAQVAMVQPDRLGDDPGGAPLGNNFKGRIAIVDCRNVDFKWWEPNRWAPWRDELRHQYYRMNPTVIRDIQEAIHGKRKRQGRYRLVESGPTRHFPPERSPR
ncbi:MAG: alpha/beta hydrolase [Gammaproteobacteria bacterium]|nr:alpha/beta hydrolase [Gammaproteobacteria bacterium]